MSTPICSSPSSLQVVQSLGRAQQRHAAARNDAFLDGRAGGMQRILDAGLLFLHLGLGGRADLDHRNAAGQLRQPLLQLLAIVVRSGLVDLRAELLDAAFDGLLAAGAVDDGGVVLVHRDALGAAQVFQAYAFQLDAGLFHDGLAAGQDARCLRASPCGDRRSPEPSRRRRSACRAAC